MGDDETTNEPDAWEGMPDPPPGTPRGESHGLGPEHDMVALLSRINENARMTRQYLGWLLFIQLAGIIATVIVILNAAGEDPNSGSNLFP